MSIAEELRKTIEELSEEKQQELLETARKLLREESNVEPDNPEYQALLKELLMKRYERHKANPETGIPAEEAARRIRQKYGWAE